MERKVGNTDYGTSTTAGVIKSSTSSRFNISSAGTPSAVTSTYAQYQDASNNSFVSKGTLDNVLSERDKYELIADVSAANDTPSISIWSSNGTNDTYDDILIKANIRTSNLGNHGLVLVVNNATINTPNAASSQDSTWYWEFDRQTADIWKITNIGTDVNNQAYQFIDFKDVLNNTGIYQDKLSSIVFTSDQGAANFADNTHFEVYGKKKF